MYVFKKALPPLTNKTKVATEPFQQSPFLCSLVPTQRFKPQREKEHSTRKGPFVTILGIPVSDRGLFSLMSLGEAWLRFAQLIASLSVGDLLLTQVS